MNQGKRLLKLFGIDIRLHFSWWLVFILLIWNLSATFFPGTYPQQTTLTYWLMGVVAAILLFLSVLLHELAHSLVAKAKKIKVESITLFFFGGIAGISEEEMKPATELQMALAGPLFSLLFSGTFYLISLVNGNFFWTAISSYISQINFMLALFNLLPGYPLDGGRAFRALLYWHYQDLRKATKIASTGGKLLAGILVFLGIFTLTFGKGEGLWFLLLGGFLYFLAKLSYEQVLIKEALSPVMVKELMKKIVVLNPEMSLKQLIQKYAHSETNAFLIKGKNFSGMLDLQKVDTLALKSSPLTKLKQLALPLAQIQSVQSDDNGYTAFRKLTEQNSEALPVMEKGKIKSVITRRALLHRLSWELKYGKIVKKMIQKKM